MHNNMHTWAPEVRTISAQCFENEPKVSHHVAYSWAAGRAMKPSSWVCHGALGSRWLPGKLDIWRSVASLDGGLCLRAEPAAKAS